MRISHPRVLALGSEEALNLDFPGFLLKDKSETHGHATQSTEMASFFQFPEVCENNFLWEIIGYDMLCIIIIDVFVVL